MPYKEGLCDLGGGQKGCNVLIVMSKNQRARFFSFLSVKIKTIRHDLASSIFFKALTPLHFSWIAIPNRVL